MTSNSFESTTLQESPVLERNGDWYDAQYNPLRDLHSPAVTFGMWLARSEAARLALICEIDVPYGPGEKETLDIFPVPPASKGNHVPTPPEKGAPIFVFIHGGYWRGSDKSLHSFIAPPFVSEGAMVVVPNYALCPGVTIDEIALQMTRAIEWIWRNAQRYGGDPSRIVVGGHSAGGHLAAMLLACRWKRVAPDLPNDLVRKAVAFSGLFDLEPLRHAPFVRDDLRLTEASARRLSPVRFPAPAGALLHAHVGGLESEEFHRQSRALQQAWGRDVVPVVDSVPDRNHFELLLDLADSSQALHRQTLALLGSSAAFGTT